MENILNSGKYLGKMLDLYILETITFWIPKGSLEVIDLGLSYFITRFSIEEDLQVMLKGALDNA